MKLQAFNGGLSTRLAPHLIGVNEAIQYTNIDNEDGTLKPVRQKLDLDTNLLEFSHWFTTIEEWVTSAVNRDYVEYRNTLYFTEDSSVPQKTTDNVNFYNLGITKPALAPLTATDVAGVLTGTYQYIITYYNSSDGAESGVSPLSAELVVASDRIAVTSIPVSADPQVDKKRLYRLGGDLTAFTLVTTIDNTDTLYTDNIADTDVEGTLLEATFYEQALNGLQFLTEHYGILMAAKGDKVYFTPIGVPNAWPSNNFIDFDTNVTGIGKVLNGILVFTLNKTYIITGTNINSLVKNTLAETQGCKEHKTIKAISKGQLLWVSNDGVCTSTGSNVDVISKPKLGKLNLAVKNAVIHDEVYYLQKSDKTILALDFRYGAVFKDLNSDTTRLVVANDVLYGFDNNTLYQMFASPLDEVYIYLSPNFTEGAYSERKSYKHFYIRANGAFTISVLVDGVIVSTKSYTGSETHDLEVPQDSQNGYSIQFLITGTAVISEIEYKARGRQSN